MAVFELQGILVHYNNWDNPTGLAPATLTLEYSTATPSLSYRIVGEYEDELPTVELTSGRPISTRVNGQVVNQNAELMLGRLTTNSGSHVVMTIYDYATNSEAIFQLAGDPLALPTNMTSLAQLFDSITAMGPATGSMGPGSTLYPAQFLNVEVTDGPSGPNVIQGTDGDDVLIGTPGDDRITTGDATAYGDVVVGSSGNDTIDASGMNLSTAFLMLDYYGFTQGLDVQINGATNTGSISKGALGTDQLIGIDRPMRAGMVDGGLMVAGGAGNDRFDVTVTGDQWLSLDGGMGTDSYILNGTGRIRLNFRSGYDLSINLATRQVLNDGFGNAETLGGSNSNLEIVGSQGNDSIIGSAADESYRYTRGNNIIDMGAGFDRVRYDTNNTVGRVNADLTTGTARITLTDGSIGTDTLRNVEWLRGSAGADTLTGDANANRLEGREGDDTLYGMAGDDTLEGGNGNDLLGGGEGNDLLYGGNGNDTLYGGLGNDTLYGDAGNDVLYGSAGRNELYGGAGNDFLQGADLGDLLGGGEGNDTVRGGAGNDTIYGGTGNDNLAGGAGNDLIYGVSGANIIYAGLGRDSVYGGTGSDTIYGGSGRSELYGNDGNDLIYAGDSGDFIGGGAGNDSIYGGVGDDTIYAGTGDDFIGGGAGNDVIYGGTGANRIYGGVGDDTIHAGTGKDVMTGSPGADHFVFASAAHIGIGVNRDVITDFESGIDKINLQALSTSFNGTAGLTGAGASFYYFAASGLLIGDQNGDGVADWVLELQNKPAALLASDFLL